MVLAHVAFHGAELIQHNLHPDFGTVVFLVATAHSALLFYALLSQMAYFALVLSTILRQINRKISDKCKTDDSFSCTADALDRAFSLVDDMSEVYGLSLIVMYVIHLVWITSTLFYLLMDGFDQEIIIISLTYLLVDALVVISLCAFTVILSQIPKEVRVLSLPRT